MTSNGTLIKEYDLGDFGGVSFQPRTITASGDVYALMFKEDRRVGWAVLDRSTGRWKKVTRHPRGSLIGSDGDNLIFAEHDGAWTVLHTVAASSLGHSDRDIMD